MEIKRRDFLRLAAGGTLAAAGAAAGGGPQKAEAAGGNKKARLPEAEGFLYDSTVCVGCKMCVAACKQANDMPPVFPEGSKADRLWDMPEELSADTLNIIKLYKTGKGTEKDQLKDGFAFVKRQCMHCVEPGCVSACPVSALTKDTKSGLVRYDKDACLGCRYCQIACPYNIPKFEWDDPFPRIVKCQLCEQPVKDKKVPYAACAFQCPTGATVFGRVEDLLEEARRRLTLPVGSYQEYPVGSLYEKTAGSLRKVTPYVEHIYGEKEVGGSQVLMLSGLPFETLGMPVLPDESYVSKSEGLQHALYKWLALPIVVGAGLVWAAKRTTDRHRDID